MVARVFGGLIYLAATGMWTLLMLLIGALRCDDSCSSSSTSWADDPQAWQYEVLPWLGLAGALLAILAFTISLFRQELGLAVVGIHAGVFLANALLFVDGGRMNGSVIVFPALIAAAAAFVAVGGARPHPR